ncbi:MAG: competence/damage-inducible protein A [Planctomycetota bacterium]
MITAEIISVGDEVVSGQIADTNAAWLSQRLGDLGIGVASHRAVCDARSEIVDAVRQAAAGANVIVISGGIGPTHDDLTREAVAEAAGAELVPDPPALEHIRDLFGARGLEMPESNAKQATYPAGGDILPNANGTAAGFRVTIGNADVFALPGVPGEMKQMFTGEVVPRLPRSEGAFAVRALQCFGMSESIIAERLGGEIDLDGNPKVGLLATDGVISVKFTACAETREAALDLIGPPCERARELLGEPVFGEDDDTLERAVARLLGEQCKTIAAAESCTGGLVAHRLTNVPGISAHFIEGAVTYSNESKTRLLGVPAELFAAAGAVSEEVARLMAENVRRRAGADIGIGISGIAGPGGGAPEKPVGTVHVAVATAAGTVHRKLALRGARELIKDRAAKHALNMVRLVLGGQ